MFCFHKNHRQNFSVQNKVLVITQPWLHPNLNFETLKCEEKLLENKDQ